MSALIQYTRDKRNNRKGVLVAVKTNNGYSIGWASCSPKDKFDRTTGITLALERASKWGTERASWQKQTKPLAIEAELQKFNARCQRYFRPSIKS